MKRKQLLLLLALLITAATGVWAQESETYAVKMKAGTEDAKNWTITSGQKSATGDEPDGLTGLSEKDAVTLKYGGQLKVKSVTAVQVPDATDLSMLDCAGAPRADGRWTANCYMVHTAGYYKLPLVYGNAIKAGQANTAAYTGVESDKNYTTLTFPNHAGQAINAPWITKKTTGTGVDKGMGIAVTSAELLWQDAEGLVTAVDIDGDYLTLTVGKDATTQEGNAVVAAKDADGTIVWSWHIWVTKQTFADADLTTITTKDDTHTGTQGEDWQIYEVTPVNLGWVGDKVSKGTNTFYQWGRKDPFIGTGDVEFVESTNATIADNIKNPTKFYNVKIEKGTDQKTETHYYPCTESYYNLWNATQTKETSYSYAKATVKTVYDPCPAGFCVPTSNLYWYIYKYYKNTENKIPDWDDTNNGFSVNIGTPDLFFPATGQRSCITNGKLGYVDTDGRYWSAYAYGDSFGVYGHILYFWYDTNSNNWDTANKDRAYGFPVRAVREVATSDAPAATVVDLSTVSGDTYTVTGDVILTGTPTVSPFDIKYGGDDYEVTLDNVNSAGSKRVSVVGSNHNINIKLKGTSRLMEIFTNTGATSGKTVTIGEAAAGGTLILTGSTEPIRAKSFTINGGTVKSQATTGENWAVYLNNSVGVLTINGGALYLAAGQDGTEAVKGNTVSGTLYGWDGSAWVTYTDERYATTDNTSGNPTGWTW